MALRSDSLELPLSAVDPGGPLEAALLFRRTGVVLGSWTKRPLEGDALTVMAATMLASIDTVNESLGASAPSTVTVDADECRMFATRVDRNVFLLLIASRSAGDAYMRHTARQILAKLGDSMAGHGPAGFPPRL